MAKAMADPRMDVKADPMPLDGKRLIYRGFEVLLQQRVTTLKSARP